MIAKVLHLGPSSQSYEASKNFLFSTPCWLDDGQKHFLDLAILVYPSWMLYRKSHTSANRHNYFESQCSASWRKLFTFTVNPIPLLIDINNEFCKKIQ